MVDEAPAETAKLFAEIFAAGEVGAAIVVAQALGAAGDEFLSGLRIGEFGTAGIGETFLSRIGDLDHVAAQSTAGERCDLLHDRVGVVEEVADQHDVAGAADHRRVRQAIDERGMQDGGRQAFGGIAGGNRLHDARATDAFARAGEDFGERQHQHQRAAFLRDRGQRRLVHHRR